MTDQVEQMEVGWTDQHGNAGHLFLGDVNDYAPPTDGPLAADVVGVLEVKAEGDDFWTPTYLDRAHAEHMLAALRTMVGESSGGVKTRGLPKLIKDGEGRSRLR